jgi:hypothetical protein
MAHFHESDISISDPQNVMHHSLPQLDHISNNVLDTAHSHSAFNPFSISGHATIDGHHLPTHINHAAYVYDGHANHNHHLQHDQHNAVADTHHQIHHSHNPTNTHEAKEISHETHPDPRGTGTVEEIHRDDGSWTMIHRTDQGDVIGVDTEQGNHWFGLITHQDLRTY